MIFGIDGKVVLDDPCGRFVCVGRDATTVAYLAGSYAGGAAPSNLDALRAGMLHGQFVHLRYDIQKQRLTILTDRYGFYPFYIARVAGKIVLGADLHRLARHLGQHTFTDDEAVSGLVAFDAPFGQRTPFKGIDMAGAARCIQINLMTLAVRSTATWDPAALLSQADVPLENVKTQLVKLFQEAVEVTAQGHANLALTLSGGVDSRCLLAVCTHLGKRIETYTTGVPGSRALDYAAAMAKLSAVPNHQHPLGQGFVAALPGLMALCAQRMQGMSTASEIEAAWLSSQVPAGAMMLHGAFAELFKIGEMHRYGYTPRLAGMSADTLAQHLTQACAPRQAGRLAGFHPDRRSVLAGHARTQLAGKVHANHRTLGVAGTLQLLYIEEFLGKITRSSWQMWSPTMPLAFPFAYPPLVDLILQVRPEDKLSNRFAMFLLQQAHRGLAAFPDANTGAPIGASRLCREAIHIVDFAARKLLGSTRRADHQNFSAWLNHCEPGLRTVFAELQCGSFSFDSVAVSQMIARCQTGDTEAARALHFLWFMALSEAAPPSSLSE